MLTNRTSKKEIFIVLYMYMYVPLLVTGNLSSILNPGSGSPGTGSIPRIESELPAWWTTWEEGRGSLWGFRRGSLRGNVRYTKYKEKKIATSKDVRAKI